MLDTVRIRVFVFILGPEWYGIFGASANTNIMEYENFDIRYIGQYSITNVLNVVIKYMWQRYVMAAGNATNFIPNISVLTSKHFTYYQINNGLPSAGQTMWLHHFKSLVQAFFPALNNSFNIGTYWRTYVLIGYISATCRYRPIISANRYISLAHTDVKTVLLWLEKMLGLVI